MKSITGFAIFLILVAGLAKAGPLAEDHPERYTVQRGDTLWDIAERFLKDPWLWPEIWHVNPQIDNPHLIYPGDVVKLTFVGGKPRLEVERGRRTVRLSPEIQEEQLERAIPTIPLETIEPFLSRSRVVTESQLAAAPYIVEQGGQRLLAAAGNRVYVRGLPGDAAQQRYDAVRLGEVYKDPESGEVLGQEAVYTASGTVVRAGDPATVKLTDARRAARIGNRLLPVREELLDRHFMPHPPDQSVAGHIISVPEGVTQIGRYDVVVLDRGARDGLEPGHVLAIYRTGQRIKDTVTEDPKDTVVLPDERAGELMVFRSFERVSYALVMKATRAIHVLDGVRNP